jgi:extracellular factor (EF) 3-hydroxypalmitic acid methyl ester biosynthesis protein
MSVANAQTNGNGSHNPPAAARLLPRGPVQVKATHVAFALDGLALRGTLIRTTRHAAFFELHQPDATLRVSERLEKFEIIFQDRTVYAGPALIRNLVHTGLTLTCEAALDEARWLNVNPVYSGASGGSLLPECRAFLSEWQNSYKVLPEYKVVIADLQTFLADARLWLEQAELGRRNLPPAGMPVREREIAAQLEPMLVPAIRNLFERFEEVSRRVEPDLVLPHHAFAKRLVQPLLMGSPFVNRTLTKPLGYAGDYEMVNMMFREALAGPSLFAKLVNEYALQLPPIVAHRNRIDYLGERLEQEALRAAARRQPFRVFNLGCGPAQEIQRFMAQSELSNHARFTLLDFNDETLAYTDRVLADLKRRHARRTSVQTVKKAVHMLIKASGRAETYLRPGQYDLVYCAGLFDYLNDQVCRQLMEIFYQILAPGGLLVATNVDDHPAKNQMECFLEWNLIYRDHLELREVAPLAAHAAEVALKRDPTGVNVFIEIRKPDREN